MQPIDLLSKDIEGGPRHISQAPTVLFASNHPCMAMLGMSDGNVEMVQEHIPVKANKNFETNSSVKNDDEQ